MNMNNEFNMNDKARPCSDEGNVYLKFSDFTNLFVLSLEM